MGFIAGTVTVHRRIVVVMQRIVKPPLVEVGGDHQVERGFFHMKILSTLSLGTYLIFQQQNVIHTALSIIKYGVEEMASL